MLLVSGVVAADHNSINTLTRKFMLIFQIDIFSIVLVSLQNPTRPWIQNNRNKDFPFVYTLTTRTSPREFSPLSLFIFFLMSTKSNRRAKGDKGPAKSSQSQNFISALADPGLVNMDLLNGVSFNSPISPSQTVAVGQTAVYFGNNELYRSKIKLLLKKSTVTRIRVRLSLKCECRR